MTEDRSSIIILFLFLSANHIHVIWHWVKSLIHFFCTCFWSPFLFLGVFWLRVIFVGSLAPLGVFTKNLLGLWCLKANHDIRIVWNNFVSQLWEEFLGKGNCVSREAVSNKDHILRWCFRWAWWDFSTWVSKSSSFLKKEIYVLLAWRSDKCLSMQTVVG